MRGGQPRLALDERSRFETRAGDGGGQALRRDILMEVARLQLDDVNSPGLADPLEVVAAKNRALPQVRAEVMHQHPAGHVLNLSLRPL
jgi:hypothetical protein